MKNSRHRTRRAKLDLVVRACGTAWAVAACTLGGLAHADNPVVQTRFTADPAPLVYKDTVYLFGAV